MSDMNLANSGDYPDASSTSRPVGMDEEVARWDVDRDADPTKATSRPTEHPEAG